jgi:predicted DNA-binding transcriptional regulator YafY
MKEQCTTLKETAVRLGVSRAFFYKKKSAVEANGLQSSKAGKKILYREKAVNALISKMFETEKSFWEVQITPRDIKKYA